MNSNSWKTLGIVALICLVIFAVLSLFITALPYILIIVAIIWLGKYFTKIFSSKKDKKTTNINEEDISYVDEDENVEVIDVEYKDVDD